MRKFIRRKVEVEKNKTKKLNSTYYFIFYLIYFNLAIKLLHF